MIILRQSTAAQIIALGPFVDPAALGTPKTALTIANTDIKLLKWGSSAFVSKNSGGGTHIADGEYQATLDATDTNTLGNLMISCTMAGATPVRLNCFVYAANVYDSLVAATANLQADAVKINGSALAASRHSSLLQYGVNSSTVAASPAPTTTTFAGGLTGSSYPDNCFRNGAVIFTSGVNASLTPHSIAQFTSSSGLFTVPALPFAPTAGDTFLIVGTVA